MILGIENRTENWKTARHFVPLYQDDDARLAFVKRLGEPKETCAGDVRLELYWKGVRDYLRKQKREQGLNSETDCQDWAKLYVRRFSDLYERCFGGLRGQEQYRPGREGWEKKLYDNLRNTEIDVVLQTPNHLFIGEAKQEMAFSASTSLLLVHQLIRQYVTARLLVDRLECEIEVVPFLIVCDREKSKRYEQVKFMRNQCWLREENILEWKDVERLAL